MVAIFGYVFQNSRDFAARYAFRSSLFALLLIELMTVTRFARLTHADEYSTCRTWQELVSGTHHQYADVVRISNPGTKDNPFYNGFWFYDEGQFDVTGRYALAMRVSIANRKVTPTDVGEIGYLDLQNDNAWTKIGETTAWNWQQGCRLQWRPNSKEILWNDRSADGKQFVCRAYHFETRKRRTLPRPIYDVSNDGKYALTHSFPRMAHAGTKYVGVDDPYQHAKVPPDTGIDKMDMETGKVESLVSLARLANQAFPNGYGGQTNLYIFREGWNPSGTRFIAFLRNLDRPRHVSGWSISADGSDIRYFYKYPSHHAWLDDETMLEGDHFRVYRDDGSGKLLHHLGPVEDNTDPTILPQPYGDWILGDTYVRSGFQHLFLYHRPSKQFVPLAKLKGLAASDGIFRVDLHARTSRDGRTVCIDATHEGLGRQMYIIDIGYILDSPPSIAGR